MAVCRLKFAALLAAAAAFAFAAPVQAAPVQAPSSQLAEAEAMYGDWLDAVSAVATIDSGLTPKVSGLRRSAWAARLHALKPRLDRALATLDSAPLTPPEARVLQAIHRGLSDNAPEAPVPDPSNPVTCADASHRLSDVTTLQSALYACFEVIGNHIHFEGRQMVRTTALVELQQLEGSERRKQLFLALSPLWLAINDANTAQSPYRRMIAMTAGQVRDSGRSPISDAAATVGITTPEVEQWLVQVLEAWRARSSGAALEPWDYWYASASASRELSAGIARESVLPIAKRFYQDLGADLQRLGVLHDLNPRPGKAPLAYTDQVRIGRLVDHRWRPMQARVSASYEQGGLFVLNELIHEDGHAIHFAALRTRPAYFSLGDDLFFEAFADVPAWSSSEPTFQRKYLGHEVAEGSAQRELFSNVMLDVAWALFELRMLADPSADPNRLWTDITSRYLNILPHPEFSWWALRVQLVRWPGYMINYGLGAVVTADIRQQITQAIGQFDGGNPRWYPWVSAHLLRFGSSIATPQLLRRFLGRPVSPAALLRQLQRMGSIDALAGQHFGQTALE